MRKTMDKKTGQRPDRVTLMHCWIIGFVQDREDSGLDTFPKDIEKEFSINRSTTSEMLKLMCKKGMIEREEVEYDARLKKIVLTESSRNHKMKKMHQKLIKDLSEEEINMFIKISDKLINNIKEDL
jgi:DNA-binding MarR family transcriptional regulator